jgi:peroxiredoxin Q/BCP
MKKIFLLMSILLGIGTYTMASTQIKVGDQAPDFSIPDQNGKMIQLSNFKGKPIVLYFYPKDETPGCTKEACSFRDAYEDFKKVGAEVIGISSDDAQSHKNFAAHHRLPFVLLSDEGGKVRKEFGVPSSLGFLPGRVTYVIDGKGVVRNIFSSQINIQKHISEALEVIKKM